MKCLQNHIKQEKPAIPTEAQYNVDDNGWALIETYIWDIGDDEEIEKLIDKAIRILLINPEFENFLWKNKKTLTKIYDDKSFGQVVSQIHGIIMDITQEMVIAQMETTSTLQSLKQTVNLGSLQGMFKHVTSKSDQDDDNELEINTVQNKEEDKELAALSDDEVYRINTDSEMNMAEKYAFWNMTVYNELKKVFNITNKARESYLWSYLLSVACCIV